MVKISSDNDGILTAMEKDQLGRFLATQNRIEKYLRKVLKQPEHVFYSELIRLYANGEKGWRDGPQLREYARLRNMLVHDPQQPFGYFWVPTIAVVEDIEAICDRLLEPPRVTPTFSRSVTILDSKDSLEKALIQVEKCDFSQFPVFRGDAFRGLLTENGIARWLGNYAVSKLSLVELADVLVGQILNEEEPRDNWVFVPANTPITHVRGLFISMPQLEAILITKLGEPERNISGIITRWDISQLLQDRKEQ